MIANARIQLIETGDCGLAKDKHADASISKFSTDGVLCFSIGNLTRIPPTALQREVISLALHEIVHMSGGDETEARVYQERFSEYFVKRFGTLSRQDLITSIQEKFDEAKYQLAEAGRLNNKSQGHPAVFGVVTRVALTMMSIPYLYDPTVLNFILNPATPKNYQYFEQAVTSVAGTVIRGFGIASATAFKYDRWNEQVSVPPSSKEIAVRIAQLDRYIAIARDNFEAYLLENKEYQCLVNHIQIPGIYSLTGPGGGPRLVYLEIMSACPDGRMVDPAETLAEGPHSPAHRPK